MLLVLQDDSVHRNIYLFLLFIVILHPFVVVLHLFVVIYIALYLFD